MEVTNRWRRAGSGNGEDLARPLPGRLLKLPRRVACSELSEQLAKPVLSPMWAGFGAFGRAVRGEACRRTLRGRRGARQR